MFVSKKSSQKLRGFYNKLSKNKYIVSKETIISHEQISLLRRQILSQVVKGHWLDTHTL